MMADVSAVMVPVSLSCDHALLMSCDPCHVTSCHVTSCHVTIRPHVMRPCMPMSYDCHVITCNTCLLKKYAGQRTYSG